MSVEATIEAIREDFGRARGSGGIGMAEYRTFRAAEKGIIPIGLARKISQDLWRLVDKKHGNDLTGRWK